VVLGVDSNRLVAPEGNVPAGTAAPRPWTGLFPEPDKTNLSVRSVTPESRPSRALRASQRLRAMP